MYLSKVLPLFVMPLGVMLAFGVLAYVLIVKGARKTGLVFLALGLVYTYVLSMPFVADHLLRVVESEYPPLTLDEIPAKPCMIVLGGALDAAAPPRVDIEMNEAVDRVYKTAQLYRAGKAPFIIVTGGRQMWSKDVPAEAELIRELLMEWGVPRNAIVLEGSSRNTRENAVYSRIAADSMNCTEALLVTSAAHMPRSVAAFEAAGMPVIPVSTDVRVAETAHVTVMDFLPDAGALEQSSDALRELIGRWVYKLRGWS